jgi:hypothetical protein
MNNSLSIYTLGSNNPLKGLIKGSHVPADPGGTPVGTMGGVTAAIELAEQTFDLGLGKGLVGTDRTVAGHHHAGSLQGLLKTGGRTDLGKCFHHLD